MRRSDDDIIKNLNPILQNKTKDWFLVFRSISVGHLSSYHSTPPQIPIVMSVVPWTVYIKKQQVFFLRCIKVCSICTSPSITPPKRYRDKQINAQSELSLNSFHLELCHLNRLVVVLTVFYKICIYYSFSFNCMFYFLGSCEQALLLSSLVCGSEGTVSHQGAAVSFSYLNRLQIILEYAWEKVKKEGECPGTAAGKLVILI